MADTPLATVPGWSADHAARLQPSWITTAEQVVALSATTGGTRSLGEQLGVSEQEAHRLVEAARAAISEADRAELEAGADTSQFGLGALGPRDNN